jgi:hypothetical protein
LKKQLLKPINESLEIASPLLYIIRENSQFVKQNLDFLPIQFAQLNLPKPVKSILAPVILPGKTAGGAKRDARAGEALLKHNLFVVSFLTRSYFLLSIKNHQSKIGNTFKGVPHPPTLTV